MMEYIKLTQRLSVASIVDLCRDILAGIGTAVQYIDGESNISEIAGVADGRCVAANTVCFLEKVPRQTLPVALKNALVITRPDLVSSLTGCNLLVTADPRALFIDLLDRLIVYPGFNSFSSIIDAVPMIDPEAEIHPCAIIEDGVGIGAGTRIAAGCVIKRGTFIGKDVTIRENTVVGCDGIALYKALDGRVLRFPHVAGVIIEDQVEIGANCVLPRGAMKCSRVGSQSVIGNLCNLGHAVQIGRKVWMSVGCLIGGNSVIGDGSSLGLGVNVRDNLQIGQNCSLGMGSVVVKNLPDGDSVFGNPAKRMPRIKAGPER
ncbi:LbetaH domain-containing protein [Methylomonas rhizoryzae]|nr:hypothetical protein [Methylomonas rhizoryzae]